jgi:hypothetical protein
MPDDKQEHLSYIDAEGKPGRRRLHEKFWRKATWARLKAITRRRLLERETPRKKWTSS